VPDGFDVYGGGELLNGLLAQSNLSRSASDQFRVRARAYEIAPTGSYAAQKIHEDRRGFCRDTQPGKCPVMSQISESSRVTVITGMACA
jgi:hypothetical protein